MSLGSDRLPRHPRLHRSYHLIDAPDSDALLLYREGRGVKLKPVAGSDLLPRLLGLLDGSRTVPQLVEALGEPSAELVMASLSSLHERGLLEDGPLAPAPADPRTRARVDREVLFSNLVADGAPAALAALTEASVLVVGGGIVAAALIRMLSGCGIGRIRALTADELDAAAVDGATVVAAALDHPDPAVLETLNAVCLDASVALLPAVLVGWEGHLGPTCIPGRTACVRCAGIRAKSNLSRYREYLLYEDALRRNPAGHPLGRLPHFTDVLAGLAATELVKLITSCYPATTYGRVLVIDLLMSDTEYHDVLRVPRCPACSRLTRRAQGKPPHRTPSWSPTAADAFS